MTTGRPLLHATTCTLGAGPQSLAVATHLHAADPGSLATHVTLDESGSWTAAWRERFRRLEIEALRSPVVHHPGADVGAFAAHVHEHRLPRSGLPFDVPTAAAFESWCDRLVDDAALAPPLRARIHEVAADADGITVDTDVATVRTERLIVATNPHRRSIPTWIDPLLGRVPGLVSHGDDVDLTAIDDLEGHTVLVVGAGLTAGHLMVGAARRGARVEVLTRRPIVVRDFDTEPGWLGPKFLRAYYDDDDPASRLATALAARGGGSMPGWMRRQLSALEGSGQLTVHEARTVVSATSTDTAATVSLDDGTEIGADRVWLATGSRPDLHAARYLQQVAADMPCVDGFPVTDEHMRCGPYPIYVTGRLATITLGPSAGNLWGAQRAARRIAAAITGVDVERTGPNTPIPPSSVLRPGGRR